MDERTFTCKDGTRWMVRALARPSPYRIAVVFERQGGGSEGPLQGEVEAPGLEDLTETELCFLVNDLRARGGGMG